MMRTRVFTGVGCVVAAVLAVGLLGCSKDMESLVVVTAVPADGTVTGLDTLIVSVGKTSETFALPSPLTTAGVTVGVYVPESDTGKQTVTATATHSTGACGPGYAGTASITITKAGDTVPVSVPMSAQPTCPPTTGSTGTGGRGTGGSGQGTGGGSGTGGTGGGSGTGGGTGTGGTGGSTGGSTGEAPPDFTNCMEIDHGTAGACASGCPSTGTDVTVYGVAISPNGATVVTGGSDGNVKVWNNTAGTLTAQGTVLAAKAGSSLGLSVVAFSPDGSTLAIGRVGTVDIVNVSTWKVTRSLTLATGQEAYGVAFSPDGTDVFAIAVDDPSTGLTGSLYAFAVGNVQSLKSVPLTVPFGLGVSPVTVSGVVPVAVTDTNGDVAIYSWSSSTNTFTGPVSLTVTSDASAAETAAFSPGGTVFASGGDDGILSFWNFPTGSNASPDGQINVYAVTSDYSDEIGSVAFSPKGGYVGVAAELFGSLTAYSLADGSQVGVEYDSSYDVVSLAFSSNSTVVVAGELDCGCVVVCPQ